MPFDFTDHMRQEARWLLELTRERGFAGHARFRLLELEADPLYAQPFMEILQESVREQGRDWIEFLAWLRKSSRSGAE